MSELVEAAKHVSFYATNITDGWKRINDLPNLQLALEAFEDRVSSRPVNESAVVYDQSTMAFPATLDSTKNPTSDTKEEIQDELEAFLTSTEKLGNNRFNGEGKDSADAAEESYESDGGTRYIKDWRTGNWVHEGLLKSRTDTVSSNSQSNKRQTTAVASAPATKKRKNAKFAAKNSKCWVYITGLPPDTTEEELSTFCSKAGILDLDIETQRP